MASDFAGVRLALVPIRRGFTLIELALVVAVIGLLASLAVPNYRAFVLRGRTAEARALLESIAHAELGYFRDHGRYQACAGSADEPPRGRAEGFDAARGGWKELGFAVDGAVRYQYEVALEGASFKVRAHGDLDGDGVKSSFTLDGATMRLAVENELE